MKNKEKINFNNLLENIIYDVFSKLLEGKQNIEAHKENGGGWNPTLTKTLDMSVVVIDKDKLKKAQNFIEIQNSEALQEHIIPSHISQKKPYLKLKKYE